MFGVVQTSRRRLDEHKQHAGERALEEIRSLAAPLRGIRVLNLSLSPFGTVVAELLHSLVPLMQDLGIEVDWRLVQGDAGFGHTSRLIYQGLSGHQVEWTDAVRESWHLYNRLNATLIDGSYDVAIVHDPQAVGLLPALREIKRPAGIGRWVWHCHLDLRRTQPEVWGSILPAVRSYDAVVLADRSFAPPDLDGVSMSVIPPAIDPTSARNVGVSAATVRRFLAQQQLDPGRPLVVQVGSLDSSFDPIGAIDVYRRAKAEHPDLQLLLIQPTVETSLEAWSRFERVARYAGGDPGVRVLVGQGDFGQTTVNAAQRGASVVIQRSVPAGFAMPVWEAQWKSRPVVVGATGGLADQVADGATGCTAEDDDCFVGALLALVADRTRAARLGAAGRQAVRQHHLITRFLADELRLLGTLASGAPSCVEQEVPTHA